MNSANETVKPELERIDQEIQQTREEERHYRQQKKILAHQGKKLERKARNHRIYVRGGMLEKFLREPLLLTNDQVFLILQESFSRDSVRDLESKLIAETTEALTKEAENEETG